MVQTPWDREIDGMGLNRIEIDAPTFGKLDGWTDCIDLGYRQGMDWMNLVPSRMECEERTRCKWDCGDGDAIGKSDPKPNMYIVTRG